MARVDRAVEKILIAEPHLTHAEAVRLVVTKGNRTRLEKAQAAKKRRAEDRKAKGKKPKRKSNVRPVSGGAVSPR